MKETLRGRERERRLNKIRRGTMMLLLLMMMMMMKKTKVTWRSEDRLIKGGEGEGGDVKRLKRAS